MTAKRKPTPQGRLDDLQVTLSVKLSAVLTLGVYSGEIDRACIAENLRRFVADLDDETFADLIDAVEIIEVAAEDGALVLASSMGSEP